MDTSCMDLLLTEQPSALLPAPSKGLAERNAVAFYTIMQWLFTALCSDQAKSFTEAQDFQVWAPAL